MPPESGFYYPHNDQQIAFTTPKNEWQEILQTRQRFIISNLQTDQIEHKGRKLTALNCQTSEEGKWLVFLDNANMNPVETLCKNQEMRNLFTELTKSQQINMMLTTDPRKISHDRGLHFWAANWEETLKDFFSSAKLTRHYPFQPCLTEVKLGKNGIADVVALNGRINIFEFGNSGKNAQVRNHALGIRNIYKTVNGSNLSPESVMPFVVKYHYKADQNFLLVQNPDQNAGLPKSAIIYAKEAQEALQ